MEQNSNSRIRRFLLLLFLARNSTPPYLQTIQACLEAVLYVAVINGFPLASALFSPSAANATISLILLGLLVGRLLAGVSLVRFVYIPVLCFALVDASPACIAFLVLLGLLLAIDVVSSTSFDFYSDNLAAESLNACKLLHFAVVLFGVGQAVLGGNFILDGACSGAWVGVWLCKRASVCRSRGFKELQLVGYLWLAASHLMVMTTNWLAVPLLVQVALPLGFAQALLRVYLEKRGTNKLDELYSQENYLKMAFELMIYLHGETFSPAMDKQIEAFLADPHYSSLKDADRRRLVYEKLIDILARRGSYEEQLISCQIFLFHNHQLLKAKALLTRLERQVGCLSWMRRVCLYRVGETLREVYALKSAEIHFAHYAEYYRCDAFRSLLLRSAAAFIALWEYTRRPEVISQRLRGLADRLVRLERRLRAEFAAIQPKCLTLSLLYVSYLLEVARDSMQANAILEALAFNEDFEVNLQLDEKLFVEVSLEGEAAVFERVGPNASLLLGFEKKELEGQRLDVLLPEFYRKFHSSYVAECFEREFSRLYLYTKKTVVRNRWGYYEECNVMLRLHFGAAGALVLRGYLQVKPNPAYAWTHFLFISENEEILECAESLADFAPSATRLHRASELFEEVRLYKTLVLRTADSLAEYDPLLVFETDTQRVFYYVRALREEAAGAGAAKAGEGAAQLLETMQLRKLEWETVKRYYLRAQELLASLYAREYLLLAAGAVLALGGVLACEGFFLRGAAAQAETEQSTIATAGQVLSYYDCSLALGMRLNYVSLRRAYNYTNNISKDNLLNLALALQTNNERLKGFTDSKYSLPSLIPNVTYQKPNYDMIVELLSNAYMIRQFTDDAFFQTAVLARARLSLYSIFAGSLGEYEANFVQSIREMPPKTGDFVAIVCLLVLLAVVCAIVARVEHRLRRDEQQSLSLLASVQHQEDLIATTRQFISKLTREDPAGLRYEQDPPGRNAVYNSSFAPDTTGRGGGERDGSASRSEMSLREISGRDLLGDSLNRSGVLQTVVTSRLDPSPPSFSAQSQEIGATPRKRWLLGGVLGLAAAIGGLSLANEVQFNVQGQIDLFSSVTGVFRLYSTGAVFSRSMILFLNLVAQRVSGPIDSSQFDSFMGSYSAEQVVVTFPESAFPEFAPFQARLSDVTYQYLCSYLSCDPAFAGEVNIIYSTTIQKLITSALVWKRQLNAMDVAVLAAAAKNGSMTHFIDLVYYSEMTIRSALQDVFELYLECFRQYSDNLALKKQALVGAALALTLLALCLLVALVFYVVRHQGFLRDIAGLVKTDSYINEDHPIADKEGGRPLADGQK